MGPRCTLVSSNYAVGLGEHRKEKQRKKKTKEKSTPLGVMTGASVPRSSPRLLLVAWCPHMICAWLVHLHHQHTCIAGQAAPDQSQIITGQIRILDWLSYSYRGVRPCELITVLKRMIWASLGKCLSTLPLCSPYHFAAFCLLDLHCGSHQTNSFNSPAFSTPPQINPKPFQNLTLAFSGCCSCNAKHLQCKV